MFYTVYKITNDINGKIYIGCHKTNDLNDGYMGSGKLLQRAIKKYGVDNFHKEILSIYASEDEMFEEEARLVNESFVSKSTTYNAKIGGIGKWPEHAAYKGGKASGRLHAEKCKNDLEYRREFSNKIKNGLKNSNKEARRFTGKKHNKESKDKIGRANAILQKGEFNSNYGKCWIYNERLKESKLINKDNLSTFLLDGWKCGRKLKF